MRPSLSTIGLGVRFPTTGALMVSCLWAPGSGLEMRVVDPLGDCSSTRRTADLLFVVTLFGVYSRFFAGARMQQRLPGMSPAASGSATGMKREAVGSLSSDSRRRLREAVWSVQPALLQRTVDGRKVWPASFLTATYPAEDLVRHVEDPRLHKRHLHIFGKALQRFSPGSWFVWVLEHQGNGSLHFHFLVRWGVQPQRWPTCQSWLSETWSSIAADGREGDDDGAVREKSYRVGTNLKPVSMGRRLVEYVAKAGSKRSRDVLPAVAVGAAAELAKRSQKHMQIRGQGRWWGIGNRKGYLAARSVLEVYLPADVGLRLWQAMAEEWRTFYRRRLDKSNDEIAALHLPRWLSVEHFQRALLEADGQYALWTSSAVDVTTGEQISLDDEDLGEARSA